MPLRDVCTPQRLSYYTRDCAGRGREGAVSHITPLAQRVIEIYQSQKWNVWFDTILPEKIHTQKNGYRDELKREININIGINIGIETEWVTEIDTEVET